MPGLVAAPTAPRLIPKCDQGVSVSVWVEVLLGKFLHSIPTNRLCADLQSLGAPIAPGTATRTDAGYGFNESALTGLPNAIDTNNR